jgi:hypothetical protein
MGDEQTDSQDGDLISLYISFRREIMLKIHIVAYNQCSLLATVLCNTLLQEFCKVKFRVLTTSVKVDVFWDGVI